MKKIKKCNLKWKIFQPPRYHSPLQSTLAMLKNHIRNSIQTAHTHINEIENVFFFLFFLRFFLFIFLSNLYIFYFYFLKWILSMYDYVCPTTIRTPTTTTNSMYTYLFYRFWVTLGRIYNRDISK